MGTMAHPKPLGKLRLGGLRFQVNQGKKKKRKILETSISMEKSQNVVAGACHLSYSGKGKTGILQSRPPWAKSETLSLK
jgi:hypothetical protein